MSELAARIEAFLREQRTWVSGAEICRACGLLDTRALRALGKKPAICASFAISNSKKGFRHVAFATQGELMHAYRARRKHAIGEMINARRMLREWQARRSAEQLQLL